MGNRFNMLKTTVQYGSERWDAESSREAFRSLLLRVKKDYPERWEDIHSNIPAVARFDELKYNLPKMQAVMHKVCLILGIKYGKDIKIDGKTKSHKFRKPRNEVRFEIQGTKRDATHGRGAFSGTTHDEDALIESLRVDVQIAQRRLEAAEMRKKIKETMGLTDHGFNAIIEEIARNQRG